MSSKQTSPSPASSRLTSADLVCVCLVDEAGDWVVGVPSDGTPGTLTAAEAAPYLAAGVLVLADQPVPAADAADHKE